MCVFVTGICTGPRKEFFACFAKALAGGSEKLFCVCDNDQLRYNYYRFQYTPEYRVMMSILSSLQPCQILHEVNDNLGALYVERHTHLLELVAMVIAHSVFHGDIVGLQLCTPMIKQVCYITVWLVGREGRELLMTRCFGPANTISLSHLFATSLARLHIGSLYCTIVCVCVF